MLAQRRPIFHRLLDFENELFAVVTAALDRQSLLNSNSSFAESLYGLRRSSVRGGATPKASLHQSSQRWSLVFLVKAAASCIYSCSLVHMLSPAIAVCIGCFAVLAIQDGDHLQQAQAARTGTFRFALHARPICCRRSQPGRSCLTSQMSRLLAHLLLQHFASWQVPEQLTFFAAIPV